MAIEPSLVPLQKLTLGGFTINMPPIKLPFMARHFHMMPCFNRNVFHAYQ